MDELGKTIRKESEIKHKPISFHQLNSGRRTSEGKILAIISPSGYCVCYRSNGLPRFICSETGGFLCDKNGAMYHKWKWDDIKHHEFDKIRTKLSLNVKV